MASFHLLVSYATIILAIIAGITYATRSIWGPRLRRFRYSPVHDSFESDIQNGLTSNSFDLFQNVLSQDSRAGLDEASSMEIKGIMKKQQCSFDQARLIYLRNTMSRNNIDPSGLPLDSKAITKL
ncbi:ER membrane DUF2015 family conserved fungal protein [Schizosaccharomyces osmophilus]|uniref:ER membrane DUF2015 family conserved fungal protein n=1 Tax=Schizosaccharomyces osmophilus TaxID=2545709 RepID=A0AAE9WAJ2_9SCHI|nr:ER membrane DUF2015 family conserved fungal protein [Schizosaccharomyces osmophilus]WBW72731.1 ER membrane DUF2015 family conserved fungal protein [Schizosaccharomyces osmophilus]